MSKKLSLITKEGKLHPLVLLIFAICLGVVGQLTLKKGIDSVGVITLSGLHWGLIPLLLKQPFIVFGFCCYFMSAGLYLVVISQVPLSYAYPLVSIGYVLVVIFAKTIFHEEVSIWRWMGVGLICCGVLLIAKSGSDVKKPGTPIEKTTHSVSAGE
jgi:multidrug transporter EmrE-like cation transporter